MSYELSVHRLVHKTKEELIEQISVEIDEFNQAEENYGDGEGINHIGNIESICYVLRNCEYKGREQ